MLKSVIWSTFLSSWLEIAATLLAGIRLPTFSSTPLMEIRRCIVKGSVSSGFVSLSGTNPNRVCNIVYDINGVIITSMEKLADYPSIYFSLYENSSTYFLYKSALMFKKFLNLGTLPALKFKNFLNLGILPFEVLLHEFLSVVDSWCGENVLVEEMEACNPTTANSDTNCLLDGNDRWCIDAVDLESIIMNYFNSIFSSSNPPDGELILVLELVIPMVSVRINNDLSRDFAEKKVTLAISQMRPTNLQALMV
ncbi:hypothetical protein ACH5RR_021399 [Cinchona calisaya]|uniref:Uncharacterized protein n=1 Tax=Cinchona calisaya TaxID=153742 RepID=A0ABD2ZH68_9GENT